MKTPLQEKNKCKHNGRKGYCNAISGFKCLKCGAECIEENGEIKEKTV